MKLPLQKGHKMVYDMLNLFQNEEHVIDNDDHVQHGIPHSDHIAGTQSKNALYQ